MADEDKKTQQEKDIEGVRSAINELRESIKKNGVDSIEHKERQDKIEAALKTFDENHNKSVMEIAQKQKEAEETKERLEALEISFAKGGANEKVNHKETPEYKSINSFIKHGKAPGAEGASMTLDEIKALRTDIDTAGGYLVTPETDNVITKEIIELSPVRSVARVRTVSKKTLDMPIRAGVPEAFYEGEAEQGQQGESDYKSESVNAFRLTVQVPVTFDQLIDANFDMENEISSDVALGMAFKEGNRMVLGDAPKQPEGFMANTTLQTNARVSTVSGSLAAVDLINLTGDIKFGQNPMYAFNRQTLATIRGLESTNGQFIFHAGSFDGGMGGSRPNVIAGEPYVIMQDMASLSANSFSVVYADFRRGYVIIDRTGLAVIRDDVTQARNNIVLLTFHKYNTGQIVLEEAFKYLKTKA